MRCLNEKGLKICYEKVHNMFRTLRSNFFGKNYNYNCNCNYSSSVNYKSVGGGGGDDPRLFLMFLFGVTVYSLNKLRK